MAGAPRGNRNAEKPGKPGFTVTIRITKPMRERLEKMLDTESEEELKVAVRENLESMLTAYIESSLGSERYERKIIYTAGERPC